MPSATTETLQPSSSSSSPGTSPLAPEGTRQRLRQDVNMPKKRKKRATRDAATEAEQEALRKCDLIDRKSRWMVFLNMTWDSTIADKIIKSVYGEDVHPDSTEYTWARGLLQAHNRSYKSETIKHMEQFVRDQKEAVAGTPGSIARSQDLHTLYEYFVNLFNQENFNAVFEFMAGYIDVNSGKSSGMGERFLREVWGNLAVQAKLHVDLQEKTGKPEADNKQANLLDLWETLALHPDYDEVNKSQFTELTARKAHQKRSSTKRPKILPSDNPNWIGSDTVGDDCRPHVGDDY